MGLMVAEQQQQMYQQPQQPRAASASKIEDFAGSAAGAGCVGDKDKKKKRRSNRRSKQQIGCNSVNGPPRDATKGFHDVYMSMCCSSSLQQHHQLGSWDIDPGVAFNSMPPLHMREQNAGLDIGRKVCSKSCPTSIAFEEPRRLLGNMDSHAPINLIEGHNHRSVFDAHWSTEEVKEALQNGEVFEATFRVNSHNRVEAYCTIEGVPADILICGIHLQNRAVDGDTVAIQVDPPTLWARMKGSAVNANNSFLIEDNNLCPSGTEMIDGSYKGKNKVDVDCGTAHGRNPSPLLEHECDYVDRTSSNGNFCPESTGLVSYNHANICHPPASGPTIKGCTNGQTEILNSAEKLRNVVIAFPLKRPTGKVVAILQPSPRRDAIVGFLNVKQWLLSRENQKRDIAKNKNVEPHFSHDIIQLTPTDPKFPFMMVLVQQLPNCVKKRLDDADATLEMDLVGARLEQWRKESPLPQAIVMHCFGRGGEVEPQIAAILFENCVYSPEFSPESLSCLPNNLWKVPVAELHKRNDIRNLCIFTIDPSTASDHDDALSVEKLTDEMYRIGVHVADVSYFVKPDTALDKEAQSRSTSVYFVQRKLPMLPPLLSEKLGSLNPGVDRLALSIFWDISLSGDVADRWMGHTVIRSCCKLSYEQAQDILDGHYEVESSTSSGSSLPQLHGQFEWQDVVTSIQNLHRISKVLRENRFEDGALVLENSKVAFLFDECGSPYDSMLCERKDSNFLVEEYMLLANRTAAEIISRTFPDSALLRRHPEPIMRKLREFEAFCRKHGFELDSSSSGSFRRSLENIREKLKDDAVLYDVLISYATKPMQLAKYFCTGEIKVSEKEWGHYALALPLYTHFTSPLRRYPDIVVHRTLAAAIEAEQMLLRHSKAYNSVIRVKEKCFTGIHFDKVAADSAEGSEALSAAAAQHKLPCTDVLSEVANYCNQRHLASKYVKDGVDKLYMWILLKNKQILLSEARVLALGPKFMSIYIQKLAIERRIYYDEIEGLWVEWFEATSTLVLSLCPSKRAPRRNNVGKFRSLEDVAFIVSPCSLEKEMSNLAVDSGNSEPPCEDVDSAGISGGSNAGIGPAVFPLTMRLLSTIPVALHAVGGDDGPLDIGARLYVSSYLR